MCAEAELPASKDAAIEEVLDQGHRYFGEVAFRASTEHGYVEEALVLRQRWCYLDGNPAAGSLSPKQFPGMDGEPFRLN